MDKPVLVVIDMQENFPAARNPKTLAACKQLIADAIMHVNPIIFVEYSLNGQTLTDLTSMVESYELKFRIHKSQDDGSRDIQECLDRCKVIPKKLIVCGVNTNFCVLSTVQGLHRSEHNFNIDVIAEACHDQWDKHDVGIAAMKHLSRVQVI
jgi:nicotinamidase-related amidase